MEPPRDVERYLNALFPPWDRSRRLAIGHWWERTRDGRWVTETLVPEEPGEVMTRTGERPAHVIGPNVVDLFAKRKALDPTQSDINDAYRGLEGVEVVGPDGRTRIDYPRIPLKNKDGSLSKYAKNLMDLHAPAQRVEREIGETLSPMMARPEDYE